VAARALQPEIAQAVPIEQGEVLLPVLEGDGGFTSRYTKGHAELAVVAGSCFMPP
jgi:hypothetical protein